MFILIQNIGRIDQLMRETHPNSGALNRNGAHTKDYPVQVSITHDKSGSPEVRRAYATDNYRNGTVSTNLLDFGLISGILSAGLGSYFEEGSALFSGARKVFDAIEQWTLGSRDKLMYLVFGQGIDHALEVAKKGSPEDLVDTDTLIKRSNGSVKYADDALENATQMRFCEWVVPKTWKTATDIAKVKPLIYPIAPFLPRGFTTLLYMVLESPARLLWRLRFINQSLSPDFVSKTVELTSHGLMGIFSNDHNKKFESTKAEFRKKLEGYFEHRNENHLAQNQTPTEYKGLSLPGLISKFVLARHAQHWNDLVNPEAALEDKTKDGVFKENPLKAQEESIRAKHKAGLITEEEMKVDLHDARSTELNKQRFQSISDFTGTFCASYGIFASMVLDPLHSLLNIAGVTSGLNVIKGLAEARRFTQNLNYLTRLIGYERPSDHHISDAKALASTEDATDTAKAYYKILKNRMSNFRTGIGMSALSFIEPFIYFRSSENDTSTLKFFSKVAEKASGTLFLRFFSKRRAIFGAEATLKALVAESLGKEVKDVNLEDYGKVDNITAGRISRNHLNIRKDSLGEIFKPIKAVHTYVSLLKERLSDQTYRKRLEEYAGIAV